MALTPEEVRRLAVLARITLSDAAAEALAAQLTDVLDHVEALEAPSDDEPTTSDRVPPSNPDPTGRETLRAPLRADVPGADTLDRPPADFAPEWRDGFFTVPRLPSHDTPAGEGS